MLNKLRCHTTFNFQPIRLLDPGCWYKFTYWMTNSVDPDQLANWSGSIVRLSLLTMINPNQTCEVLLFVCSKMADETNLSSNKSDVWERKLCWWCLSSDFPLRKFLLGFAFYFCFVFTSTPSYEASPLCSILCNLFPRLCWCWSL